MKQEAVVVSLSLLKRTGFGYIGRPTAIAWSPSPSPVKNLPFKCVSNFSGVFNQVHTYIPWFMYIFFNDFLKPNAKCLPK